MRHKKPTVPTSSMIGTNSQACPLTCERQSDRHEPMVETVDGDPNNRLAPDQGEREAVGQDEDEPW
jgi:hypothetical protein